MALEDVSVPTTSMGDTRLMTPIKNGDFEDLTDNWPDHWDVISCAGQTNVLRGYVERGQD